jgi:hypothetical protein
VPDRSDLAKRGSEFRLAQRLNRHGTQ